VSNYLNRCSLIGDVLVGAKLSTVRNGGKMLTFQLLTKRFWKDGAGERCEDSDIHNITLFGPFAEHAAERVHEGAKLFVEGDIEYVNWQNEKGEAKSKAQIRGRTVLFM